VAGKSEFRIVDRTGGLTAEVSLFIVQVLHILLNSVPLFGDFPGKEEAVIFWSILMR